jgi:hypothetical protein
MKHKMMGKTSIIFLASIITLAMSGATYALWYEDLYISTYIDTGEVDWEYWNYWTESNIDPTFTHDDHGIDPDFTKDVASTTGWFTDEDGDGDPETMHVTILNAYPYYHNHISFWVHCNGNIPIHIWKVVFRDSVDNEILTIYESDDDIYLDLSGPNDVPDGLPDIRVLWGDNFGKQLHYCDSADMSFGFIIQQTAPQGKTFTFTIEIVAGQYNEV